MQVLFTFAPVALTDLLGSDSDRRGLETGRPFLLDKASGNDARRDCRDRAFLTYAAYGTGYAGGTCSCTDRKPSG